MTASLTAEERERVAELFDEVASLPEDERDAFIERECQASAPVREELRRLLPAVGLEGVVARAMPRAFLAPGTRIGPYALLEKIGEGGMGEVYAADQLEPVTRRVALKLVRAGMESTEVLARFEAERQALARMGHPAVAQVFDGGTTEDGRPYFVMEFVAGEPITEHCARLGLTTRERVRLFLGVCDGVQHAHQKGIVHRDLKPSNILVADDHGTAAPKIIDFGIARATVGQLSEKSLRTLTGQVIGTLDYMSPEQAAGSGDVDTRSDIYSAGVVLYQLLSGLLPFGRIRGARTPFHELQREILEVEPPTPSARLRSGMGADTGADVAERHGTDPRGLARELRGDLDWICIKALEKDPDRRYASASEFADDLRRYLAHEPVLAGRPGPLYRARRFVRRHRVGVGAAVVITAGTLAAVLGIVSGQAEVAASQRLAMAARDAERIPEIERAADDLWPPHPGQIEAMDAWLKEAREVIEREPRHLERLRSLEEKAPSRDPEIARAREWEASSLTRAVRGMARLRSELLAEDATLEGRGASVPKRRRFAHELAAGATAGSKMALAWERAARDMPGATTDLDGDGVMEHPYESLRVVPQEGLLPIGPDPDSGLWLFVHLLTGSAPRLDETEGVVMTAETGVVFVLMPERTFWMGSDDDGFEITGPRHEVFLSTHFLSKYEMTQGQWKRLTGSNPSGYGPEGQWSREWLRPAKDASLLHPVEQVSWKAADTWLQRAGLSLPSEAQWEQGARAGTQTRYWAGETLQDLEGIANVRDQFCQRSKIEFWVKWHDDFNDGSAAHWPVGWAGRPNRFGLHDVHGNVREWCRDGYGGRGGYDSADYEESSSIDPVALPSQDERRIYRGSSWRHPLPSGASAARGYYPPSFAGSGIGVRPARSWVP